MFSGGIGLPLRLTFFLALAIGMLTIVPARAQVPIPLQEQVEVFRTLSPAQQSALIRELQSELPPAQRDAIVSMLMQQQGASEPDSASDEESLAGGPLEV